MAIRRLAEQQPDAFAFSEDNHTWAEKEIAKYPEGRQDSAVIALLWRAQAQEGWLTEPAIRVVSEILGMPKIRVLEVATFYTMFNLEPVGHIAHIWVCGTTPCWLRGADDLKEVCRRRIHAQPFRLSEDGAFSWEEVECLGACVNAPMIQIGADTFEDLTAESFETLIDDLAAGRPVKPGPQIDRQFSAPVGGPTTLTEIDAGPVANGAARAAKGSDEVAIEAAKPRAAVQTPLDPTAELSQAAEKAAQGQGTREKREEVLREATGGTTAVPDAGRPPGLSGPREGKADNLRRISGIGPKIEGTLHSLGIYHFDQIANWTGAEIAWVDQRLKFKGRIEREDWIGQAKTLAAGGGADASRSGGDKA